MPERLIALVGQHVAQPCGFGFASLDWKDRCQNQMELALPAVQGAVIAGAVLETAAGPLVPDRWQPA